MKQADYQGILFEEERLARHEFTEYEQEDRNEKIRKACRHWESIVEPFARQRVAISEAFQGCPLREKGNRSNITAWFEVDFYFLNLLGRMQGSHAAKSSQIVKDEYAARLVVKNEARMFIQVGKYE